MSLGRMSNPAAPGDLDQRIEIWRLVYAADGAGGSVGVPSLVVRCWARAAVKAVREVSDQDQLRAVGFVTFTIRNRPGLTEDDWILWGGNRYNIRGQLQAGTRDLYLDIDAERGVAD